ncbi:MAG TPA: M28 family peptidase [Candidatus Acidoferrum sp.]|nr:M28 family peptidase [Candidatus Acidoferrum sp.]
MTLFEVRSRFLLGIATCCALLTLGCKSGDSSKPAPAQPPFMSAVAGTAPAPGDEAPPAEKTGGFDGKRAYDQVAKQVSFGPRPPGSPAIIKLQEYLETELKSYGCAVETDSFSADTPVGRVPMKNILVKIPGEKPGIILLGTHYDTKKMDNFVGADDAGSSTAVMLEVARNLCKQPAGKYAVWIAFFDAEEAFNPEWKDPDNTYGSRQMAAQLAISGDLPKVKAFILADLVGGRSSRFRRDPESTQWVVELVWSTAEKLGYSDVFVSEVGGPGGDDHLSFTRRNVPSVDIIDLDPREVPYWHTTQDTLDKISPKTLAVTGHTILESIKELQKK